MSRSDWRLNAGLYGPVHDAPERESWAELLPAAESGTKGLERIERGKYVES